MTPLDLQAIYNMIPAVYRIRDAEIALQSDATLDAADAAELAGLLTQTMLSAAEQGRLAELQALQQRGPLQSMVALLAEQIEVLQESLYQGYDDLFIETCAEWLVPYIGELVGFPALADFPGTPYSLRAAVAEAIRTRRRRGTVSGLESVARDISGWPAHVVEYFLELATTQYMNHLRPANHSWVDVRNASDRLPGTPFDNSARTADVRRIATGGGLYNIPNIGVWLWRLTPYSMALAPACRVDNRRFLFDPLGRDTQLYTESAPVSQTTDRATSFNVPLPITRRMLWRNFKDIRRNRPIQGTFYGGQEENSLSIDQSQLGTPSPDWPVIECDLRDVYDGMGNVTGWAHAPTNVIAIDPELGRFALPADAPAGELLTTYSWAFSADIGGGPYSRPFVGDENSTATIKVPSDAATLTDALAKATTEFAGDTSAVTILIQTSARFVETPSISIPEKCSLTIQAADGYRPTLVLSDDMPVIGGDGSSLTLNGLLIGGGCIAVPATDGGSLNLLAKLTISHCTLAPGAIRAIEGAPAQPAGPRLYVEAEDVQLALDHTITGALRLRESGDLTAISCIIDAGAATEIAYANEDCSASGAAMTMTNCTVIGLLQTRQIVLASNCIFDALIQEGSLFPFPVNADQLQQGCTRFCYVPPGSRVPRPYRCYPGSGTGKAHVPAFTSRRQGDAGYCQLAFSTGTEIMQGADDGSEMGVFHDLHQPQRLSNLQLMLQDNLRFGLEAGIFFAS
ncbi:hypothetical protein [Granulicella tundricola]|uniref:Uncharacterized protein n=1 Tax=Granulicella tundricola (strain ATCC BAA-1859 / DSM 23138 / MP5ACTX9) TaxID=1198114 RepID=E8X5D5_GRATM|nr:hypothetical protein [Granulicella tundricola]ADW69482.1 hypothetical protein AciX9_2447 [Granulicella tundricola MP5ACTX9]